MSSVVMIVSGKGGTGKSTVACNLGLTWQMAGRKTLLIDMCSNMRCLDLYLGVENFALFDIRDILTGLCPADRCIITAPHLGGLQLIPGSQSDPSQWLRSETFGALIEVLKHSYDMIILDCPPGADITHQVCSDNSDGAVIVLTPDWPALRGAQVAEDILIKSDVAARGYIMNKVSRELAVRSLELDYKTVDRGLRCESLGAVMDDPNIRVSGTLETPIVAKNDTYIADNFRKIAAQIDRLIEDNQW